LGAIGAVVLYDIVFYFVHRFVLHHASWGYPALHLQHHRHPEGGRVHQGVTNELTLVERIGSILIANALLKVIGAHPLTRNLFVPVFIYLLTESHFPYDPPIWWDKILGWPCSNQRRHVTHHLLHATNYSPFFGITDAIMGTAYDGSCIEDLPEQESAGESKPDAWNE